MGHRAIEENEIDRENGHRLMVFGDTLESRALAAVLSLVGGPTSFRALSEAAEYITKSANIRPAIFGNKATVILHDSRRYARPTRLIDTLYELRFSIGWLGPVLIVTCTEGVNEIERTDLFRMSGNDNGPAPQRCLSSPFLLGALLNALGNMDGYGRFAWRRVKECVRDKDLIPPAHKLSKQLTACIGDALDMRQPLEQLRELLHERDGALLRFIPGHGHIGMIDRLLLRDNLCLGASDVPAELRLLIDALISLPKVTGC